MTGTDLLDELFNEFWSLYPTKKGKGAARKAYEKALKGNDKRELHKEIILAIDAQKRYRQEAQSTGEFVPQWKHPATWINQECWYDEIKSHAELKNNQPIENCTFQGCFQPVHVSGYCAEHYCQKVPANPNIVSYQDLRGAALKKNKDEPMKEYIERCKQHCKGWIR